MVGSMKIQRYKARVSPCVVVLTVISVVLFLWPTFSFFPSEATNKSVDAVFAQPNVSGIASEASVAAGSSEGRLRKSEDSESTASYASRSRVDVRTEGAGPVTVGGGDGLAVGVGGSRQDGEENVGGTTESDKRDDVESADADWDALNRLGTGTENPPPPLEWEVDEEAARKVSSTPPSHWRTAVCLVGGARDFELSGPSILHRLLSSFPPRVTLFLHSPLDEASRKLWALAWAPGLVTAAGGGKGGEAVRVDIGAVRIFPSTWVNESAYPKKVLEDPWSPQKEQGIFQYQRLVEGCVPLIKGYEKRKGMQFHWIVRTRVDTYWSRPAPPLTTYKPDAYYVPYGTDCSGLNDRFGIGTWATSHIALSRLSMLHAIFAANHSKLNSELSFKLQFAVGGVAVQRADLPFCVVSRRVYKRDLMPVASLASSASLNGAKCRPCSEQLRGKKAAAKMRRYLPWARIAPSLSGVALCNARQPWEEGWRGVFDEAVGPTLAAERQTIMSAGLQDCIRNFEQLRQLSSFWLSLPPPALCVRALLGPLSLLGDQQASFYTAMQHLRAGSVILSTSRSRPQKSSTAWDRHLHRLRPDLRIRPFQLSESTAWPPFCDILKLAPEGHDLEVVDSWIQMASAPAICQLLIGFPENMGGVERRREVHRGLQGIGFYMSACIQEPLGKIERCTFFSTQHCNEKHWVWPNT